MIPLYVTKIICLTLISNGWGGGHEEELGGGDRIIFSRMFKFLGRGATSINRSVCTTDWLSEIRTVIG